MTKGTLAAFQDRPPQTHCWLADIRQSPAPVAGSETGQRSASNPYSNVSWMLSGLRPGARPASPRAPDRVLPHRWLPVTLVPAAPRSRQPDLGARSARLTEARPGASTPRAAYAKPMPTVEIARQKAEHNLALTLPRRWLMSRV